MTETPVSGPTPSDLARQAVCLVEALAALPDAPAEAPGTAELWQELEGVLAALRLRKLGFEVRRHADA